MVYRVYSGYSLKVPIGEAEWFLCGVCDVWVSDVCCFFFFFQAEDGIRDLTVTGVQTCALPISARPEAVALRWRPPGAETATAALTWAEYADKACRVAAGLQELGVQRGERGDRKSVG